jgi:peroxiredoxin
VRLFGVELPDFAGLKGYVAAKRSVFIIDKQGNVRYAWISDNPGAEPSYQEIEETLEQIR